MPCINKVSLASSTNKLSWRVNPPFRNRKNTREKIQEENREKAGAL